jgi:hypothetical protein
MTKCIYCGFCQVSNFAIEIIIEKKTKF